MSVSRLRRRARVEASQAEGVGHLLFSAAGEYCALPLLSVQKIVGLGGLAPRPQAPRALRGVMDAAGGSLVVVDLAVALGGLGRPASAESCALVVADNVEGGPAVGLAVDALNGVIELSPSQLAPAPRLGALIDNPLVAAMAQVGAGFVPVLDLPRLLAAPEVRAAIEAGR